MSLPHLRRLEAEAIHVIREVVATFSNPVALYSIGKDSSVLLHLAMKAFYPAKPPFPFLHVDTKWKFREMIEFRDRMARELGFDLLVHVNQDGIEQGIGPFTHGSNVHTHVMKTMGSGRRSRNTASTRRSRGAARRGEVARQGTHLLDPQRPARLGSAAPAARDVEDLQYAGRARRDDAGLSALQLDRIRHLAIHPREEIPIVPLYFAARRPIVKRDGMLIMVDDDRMPIQPEEEVTEQLVRFRTLGCYPLTGAVESDAVTVPEILREMLTVRTSERQSRLIDTDEVGAMEKKKREGYF